MNDDTWQRSAKRFLSLYFIQGNYYGLSRDTKGGFLFCILIAAQKLKARTLLDLGCGWTRLNRQQTGKSRKGIDKMKRIKIGGVAAAIFLATSSLASSLEVTDVKIAQRYPWNGLVDITYTVKSDDAEKDVWVYPVGYDADTATSVALMPQYLSGEGVSNAVHQGTHRMTWYMAAQMGKDYNRAAFSVKLQAYCDSKPYLVVDLSEGSEAKDYPISYLSEIPAGGWTEEYRTTKMVFKLIPPGQVNLWTFITKPFYFAIWPMTTQQYALIMGGSGTSETKKGLSYNAIRGSLLGSMYPAHQQVDADSIAGKLRLRTGVTFDLATEWQWMAAAKGYGDLAPTESPNIFGIYELGTNVEWCINWWNGTNGYPPYITYPTKGQPFEGLDPVGAISGYKNARALCGCEIDYQYHYPNFTYSVSELHMYFRNSGGNYAYATADYDGEHSGGTWFRDILPASRPVCRLVALPNCK